MAFSYQNGRGTTYCLHGHVATLRSGRQQQIYFFRKTAEGGLDQFPDGYEVSEVNTSGLPVLKKSATG